MLSLVDKTHYHSSCCCGSFPNFVVFFVGKTSEGVGFTWTTRCVPPARGMVAQLPQTSWMLSKDIPGTWVSLSRQASKKVSCKKSRVFSFPIPSMNKLFLDTLATLFVSEIPPAIRQHDRQMIPPKIHRLKTGKSVPTIGRNPSKSSATLASTSKQRLSTQNTKLHHFQSHQARLLALSRL